MSNTASNVHSGVGDAALDVLFRKARTHTAWLPGEISDSLLKAIFDLASLGPTSANCCPARFVFVRGHEAKARLLPAMMPGNVDKTREAPVTVIVAYDMEFYEKMPKLFPHADAKSWFVGKPAFIQESAFRNGTLQGAYFILAARAMGVDCGPMSGFDPAKVNAEFFPDGKWKVNFICNLGHGDASKLHPRSPRLEFSEACKVI